MDTSRNIQLWKASCVYEHCWHNLLAYLKTNTRKGIPLFMVLPVWWQLHAVEASFKSFWHIRTPRHKLHVIFSPCGIIFPSALMNQAVIVKICMTVWNLQNGMQCTKLEHLAYSFQLQNKWELVLRLQWTESSSCLKCFVFIKLFLIISA